MNKVIKEENVEGQPGYEQEVKYIYQIGQVRAYLIQERKEGNITAEQGFDFCIKVFDAMETAYRNLDRQAGYNDHHTLEEGAARMVDVACDLLQKMVEEY